MATIDLYGTINCGINWPTARIPEITNAQLNYFGDNLIQISVDIHVGYWARGYANYYGNFLTNADGSIGGTLTGFDLGLNNGSFDIYLTGINESLESVLAAGSSEQATREWEASLLTGDDTLIGSLDGGSVSARLMGGDDFLELHSGLLNDVNTNWGNDRIRLFGGGGTVRAGKDDDVIDVVGGQWQHVNGNNSNDIITNYSEFAGTIRGGKGNDTLINADGGGYFYGDLGADTFRPYAINSSGQIISGVMFVRDFQVGVDSLDLSALGAHNIVYSEGNTLIGSAVTGKLVCSLEGVIL